MTRARCDLFTALFFATVLSIGVPGHARPFARSLVAPTLPPEWVEPIFGFEFTFLRSTPFKDFEDRRTLLRSMVDRAERRLGLRKSGRDYILPITPGKSVSFGTDPKVIEVTGTPDTVSDYSEQATVYQDVIFESGRAVGLVPHEIVGGGHVHIGRVFQNDSQLLRDFYVDMVNNPSLFAGIFGYNPKQGAIMADQGIIAFQKYLKVIARVDRLIGKRASAQKIVEILHEMQKNQRTWSVNLANLLGGIKTVEIRIAPQKSFADFLSIIKLFRARIIFLKLNPNREIRLNPGPETFEQAQAEFREFVLETGLDWNEYEHFGIKSGRSNPTWRFRLSSFDIMDPSQMKAAVRRARAEAKVAEAAELERAEQAERDRRDSQAVTAEAEAYARPTSPPGGFIARLRLRCERMLLNVLPLD